MACFSVSSAAKEYKQSPESIRRSLERGYLPGVKDLNGWWWIEKSDLENRYREPQIPEWYPLMFLASLYALSQTKMTQEMQEGKLEGRMYKRNVYIHNEEWMRYIKKKFDHCKVIDRMCHAEGEFTVLNPRGIHLRPAIFFCILAMKNRENVITLFYDDDSWGRSTIRVKTCHFK